MVTGVEMVKCERMGKTKPACFPIGRAGGQCAIVNRRSDQPWSFICCLQAFLASLLDMLLLVDCCLAIQSFIDCLWLEPEMASR